MSTKGQYCKNRNDTIIARPLFIHLEVFFQLFRSSVAVFMSANFSHLKLCGVTSEPRFIWPDINHPQCSNVREGTFQEYLWPQPSAVRNLVIVQPKKPQGERQRERERAEGEKENSLKRVVQCLRTLMYKSLSFLIVEQVAVSYNMCLRFEVTKYFDFRVARASNQKPRKRESHNFLCIFSVILNFRAQS